MPPAIQLSWLSAVTVTLGASWERSSAANADSGLPEVGQQVGFSIEVGESGKLQAKGVRALQSQQHCRQQNLFTLMVGEGSDPGGCEPPGTGCRFLSGHCPKSCQDAGILGEAFSTLARCDRAFLLKGQLLTDGASCEKGLGDIFCLVPTRSVASTPSIAACDFGLKTQSRTSPQPRRAKPLSGVLLLRNTGAEGFGCCGGQDAVLSETRSVLVPHGNRNSPVLG